MEVLELKKLRTLAVPQQAQVLEDGERVAGSRAECLCGPVWESNRLEFIGEQQPTILLDNLVNDKHNELAQRCDPRGRHDGCPRLVQLEA